MNKKMKEVVVNLRLIQGKGQYSAFFSINTIRFQNGSNAFHRFNFFTVAEIFNFCAINGDNAVPLVKKAVVARHVDESAVLGT